MDDIRFYLYYFPILYSEGVQPYTSLKDKVNIRTIKNTEKFIRMVENSRRRVLAGSFPDRCAGQLQFHGIHGRRGGLKAPVFMRRIAEV